MTEELSRFAGSLAPPLEPPVGWSGPAQDLVPGTPAPLGQRLALRPTGIVAGIAGALMVPGSFLSWMSVSASGVTVSVDGRSDGLHGGITALVGVVVAALALGIVVGGIDRASWVAVTLLAAAGAGVAWWQTTKIHDLAAQVNSVFAARLPGFEPHASVGLGLWMVLISSLVAVLASGLAAAGR